MSLSWVGSNAWCLGEINPFLASRPRCLSLLQTKCLAQTTLLKHASDGDRDSNQPPASQKQPKRHAAVRSLRQFCSRKHLKQELRGPRLSAAISWATLWLHFIGKPLQAAPNCHRYGNYSKPSRSLLFRGPWYKQSKKTLFLQRTTPKYKNRCLPHMDTEAVAGLYLTKPVLWPRTGALCSRRWLQLSPRAETAMEWHCSQTPVCTGQMSQQEILV